VTYFRFKFYMSTASGSSVHFPSNWNSNTISARSSSYYGTLHKLLS